MTWWDSPERIDRTFRRARMTAIVGYVIAAACAIVPVLAIAIPAAVVATTAVLIALFSWFRRDDLSRRPR